MIMRRLIYVLPILVLAVLGAYFAAGLGRDPQKLPSALIGKPAPQFALPSIDGQPLAFSTADLKGEVSLVNVWASWCPPCVAEAPMLLKIARAGVPIFGLDYKDKPDDAKAFLARYGNPFKAIGADRDGKVAIDWGVYGYPETFVVDRNGIVRERHISVITERDWQTKLLPLVERLRGE